MALASADAGDGTLSVEDGRGKITLQARGGVIGRIDRGTLTVYDTTPADANFPVVTGADEPEVFVAGNGVRYRGAGIRFRVVGGGFKLVIQGRGIDLSVVGKGSGFIEGDTLEPGVYSLDGADCRKNRASCDDAPRSGRSASSSARQSRRAPRNGCPARRPFWSSRTRRRSRRSSRSTSRTPATTCAPSRPAAPR